jgi:acyl-coenzyme A thioesterase PaaI-like protein
MIWLADVTASVLAIGRREIGPDGKGFPLAVNLHVSLLGNQKDGEIKAEARFVRKGDRLMVIRTRLTGKEDRLLAEVTSTHVLAD